MKTEFYTAKDASRHLRKYANTEKAKGYQRFFKTGKGQYGEGDVFIGVTVPAVNVVSKKYKTLPLSEVSALISSRIHEERLLGLKILVLQFVHASEKERARIYRFYINHFPYINNWDLVDVSAYHIIGAYLLDKKRNDIYRFAQSKNLWIKRTAIVSTFAFIRNGETEDTFRISEMLLKDTHDLIHKACGWMLREAGKRNIQALREFLDRHASNMPRTMLRYAIEKMVLQERKNYLSMK